MFKQSIPKMALSKINIKVNRFGRIPFKTVIPSVFDRAICQTTCYPRFGISPSYKNPPTFIGGRCLSGILTLFVSYHPALARLPSVNLFRQIGLSLLRKWGIRNHRANLRTPLRTGCRVLFGFLRRIPNRIPRKCTFSF